MSNKPATLRPVPVDDAIEWAAYPRVEPGEYFANCYWAKRYRDPGMRRWTCLLRWDVLSEDLLSTIAKCIPLWFALGEGDKPRASLRGKYLPEWVRANGAPPGRGDRLSPNVFTRRIARVEIGDTNSAVPYSVVRRIIRWETGGSLCQSVSKFTSQGRPSLSAVESEAFERCMSNSSPKGKREGGWGNRSGFPNGKPDDENPQPAASNASALAGVEGANQSSKHPRGGQAENGKPAKGPADQSIGGSEGFNIRRLSANPINRMRYGGA